MNMHPALQSAKSVIIPGAYNNLGLHCHGGDLNALNGGREAVNNSGRGGTLVQDAKDFYNDKIPSQYHPGLESLAQAGLKDLGFGLYAGMNGNRGGTLVQDAKDFYNKEIPSQYHPGLESLAQAGLKDLGFGLKGGSFADSDDFFGKMLDGLTEGGRQILKVAPNALKAIGMPELAGPIGAYSNYFEDNYDREKAKSDKIAEEHKRKQSGQPAPQRKYAPMPEKYRRDNNGRGLEDMIPKQLRDEGMERLKGAYNQIPPEFIEQGKHMLGMGVEDIADFKNQFEKHTRDAYNQIPSQLHPAIEAFGKSAMNSLGFGIGDYMGHLKNMAHKVAQHIPKEHHHHLEKMGRMGMEHMLRHLGKGLNLGIEPIKDSNGERPMSLDWIGKNTGIPQINDHMFGRGHCDGGNILEDIGDASSKFILGLDRDMPDWMKGSDPYKGVAYGLGGEVGDGLGAGKKPKLVKGSPEAKAYMASIRKKKGKKMEGGELPPRSRSPITDPSLLSK
jgi:hypothetical protein